jgi:D-arabinose 1-dehydrogenase-like Zn-dependent alcohol dehydrogenase
MLTTPPFESRPPAWFSMALPAPGQMLRPVWHAEPAAPGPGQLCIAVAACGVCRTDLHIVDDELAFPWHAVVPGHEIVGEVAAVGEGVAGCTVGERVGVPWLGWACGICHACRRDGEAFMRLAGSLALGVQAREYPLAEANRALDDLRARAYAGAGVLRCRTDG